MQWNWVVQVHMHITFYVIYNSYDLKMYWSKVKVFWNAGIVGFQMAWLNRRDLMEKIVLCGTLLNSVSAVGFSGKADFLESVSFHSQMTSILSNCPGYVFMNC